MAEGRRLPGAGILTVLLFIAAPIAGTAWWLYRPAPSGPPPGPGLDAVDVVCSGRVDGELPSASLDPLRPGRVVAVAVAEGAEVAAGQELLRLDDTLAKDEVDRAAPALAAANAELDAARADAKLQPVRLSSASALVAAAGERVKAARRLLDQRKTQQSFSGVTAAELAAAESEVRQLEQLETAEQGRLDELKGADPEIKVRVAQARVAAATVAVRAASKAVEDCVLKAPSAGTVLRVQASVGETVSPGTPQPPIVFRPKGQLVVRAELEQEYIGRVKAGMKAVIRDETRPQSPEWTGRLKRVSGWVARRRSIVLEPGELNDVRTVECLVELDPPKEPLLVGQRVRVRFTRAD